MAASRDQLWTESNDWKGVPSGVKFKETSKGTPYMEVAFTVEGHTKYCKLWLTEKTEATTMQKLKDLGFNNDWDNPALNRTEPVRLTCKHSEWQGKWYEEWTYWGERESTPVDKSKAMRFAAAYRNVAGVSGVPKPSTPSASVPKPTPPKPAPVKQEENVVASDENSAWEYWCKKTTDEKLRNEGWLQTVEEIKPKTAADWNRVALSVDIPF